LTIPVIDFIIIEQYSPFAGEATYVASGANLTRRILTEVTPSWDPQLEERFY
jgi:hypothetical protein